MTNLQEGAPRISGPWLRRIWLWTPIAAGTVVAALAAGFLLVPTWKQLARDTERLRMLEGLRDEISQLRTQLARIETSTQDAEEVNTRILSVIAGSGDLATFLAKLDQEARATRVQLDLFEPQAVQAQTPEAKAGGKTAKVAGQRPGKADGDAESAAADPLAIKGLTRESKIIVARGSFPALLSFLRRLEALNVLVAQSDLSLNLKEAKGASEGPPKADPVELKLVVSLYGKPEAELASARTPAPDSPDAVE